MKRATLHDIIDTPMMDEWVKTNVPTHFQTATLKRQAANLSEKQVEALAHAHGLSAPVTDGANARL